VALFNTDPAVPFGRRFPSAVLLGQAFLAGFFFVQLLAVVVAFESLLDKEETEEELDGRVTVFVVRGGISNLDTSSGVICAMEPV